MSTKMKNAKKGTGSVYPERAIDAAGPVAQVEPLLDGGQLRRMYFFGVPMTSPITKQTLCDKDLDDFVKRAVNLFALDAQIDVQPVVRRHRLSFDPNLYAQHIALEIPNKPIRKVIRLAICSANYRDMRDEDGNLEQDKTYPSGGQIYTIPNDWIEMGNAVRGYLNVIPISPAFGSMSTGLAMTQAGATVMQFIHGQGFVPAYWTVECLHGVMCDEGNVPVVVNEAIAARAAMLLIEALLPLYRATSQSMGMDGLSQSVSDNMLQLLQTKREMAEQTYKDIIKRLKTLYSIKLFSSNV